jgi:predicted nucleic acid-binding protein
MAKKRIALLAEIPLLDVHEVVIRLAKDLVADSVLPQRAADDALHIACAAAHRMDFLLTWNCRHMPIRTINGESALVLPGMASKCQ